MISLWVEGYRASGDSSGASFLGNYNVSTLKEAVIEFRDALENQHSYDCVDVDRLSFWGCKFFDNEEDARKSFG